MQTIEERAAKRNAYYEANKEEQKDKVAARDKLYREVNKARIAANYARWYAKKRAVALAESAIYAEEHKEEIAIAKEFKRKAKAVKHQQAKQLRLKARSLMIFQYKGSKCAHCSLHEPDHLEIYDYHHVDPATKLYMISDVIKGSLDKLMIEVDKCLLLCAHCHRKEHTRLHKEKLNEHKE